MSLGPTVLYFYIFRQILEKTIAIFEINKIGFLGMQSFILKKKNKIWEQSCLIWLLLDWNLKEISTFEFGKMQRFIWNKQKNQSCVIWVLFDWNLKKTYCRIWHQHHWICQNANCTVKNIKYRTKIGLFGYFWIGIGKQTIFHNWNKYSWIFQNTKFHLKQKTMRLRRKVTIFGTFRSESEIFMVMFEISYFKSVKIQSFMVKNKIEVWDQNYY